jgi:hypothetical protein
MDDEHLCAVNLWSFIPVTVILSWVRDCRAMFQPLPQAIINILLDARVAVSRKLNEV